MTLNEQTGAAKLAAEADGGTLPEPVVLAEAAAGSMEVLPIALLKVDHAYQRDLSMALVQKIARNYDLSAAGPIVVSKRTNGEYFIVNGQHRAAGAQMAGETEILAQVVHGLSAEQEAELRLKGNTRRSDSSFERFRAQRAAGHADTLAIDSIVEGLGSKVNSWSDQKHGINSIATLEWLYGRDGGLVLVRVLELARDAYGELNGQAAAVATLKGLAWLLDRHTLGAGELNRQRLVDRLGAEGIEELYRRTRSHQANLGGARWMNLYRAAIEMYNEGLPENKRIHWRTGGWSKESGYSDTSANRESGDLAVLPKS